jgi:chromosome segregation ATPase
MDHIFPGSTFLLKKLIEQGSQSNGRPTDSWANDLHRKGWWNPYQPSATTGGSGMSTIEEAHAGVGQSNDVAGEAAQAAQQAQQEATEATQAAQNAQQEAEEATQSANNAKDKIEEALQSHMAHADGSHDSEADDRKAHLQEALKMEEEAVQKFQAAQEKQEEAVKAFEEAQQDQEEIVKLLGGSVEHGDNLIKKW